MKLWRVFPWDRGAPAGSRFAPDYLPHQSGQGRFDLPPATGASSRYVAESPEHAVAEKIQNLRNRTLEEDFLFEYGHRLALCPVTLDVDLPVADLCDPAVLAERRIPPDELAYRDRRVTQRVAAELHADPGLAGFRWWSALFGEWHTVVLFSDRLPDDAVAFRQPEPIEPDHPALVAAAAALAIEIAGQ